MRNRSDKHYGSPGRYSIGLALSCLLFFGCQVNAQSEETARTLKRLTDERLLLTAELDQYRKSLEILHTDGTPPEESTNPAIRTLALESVALKQRLIAITEQEVTLLQQQLSDAKARATPAPGEESLASSEAKPDDAVESKPLRTQNVDYAREWEAANVGRLHGLLESYYTELQESARILPTAEEIARREMAQRDADTLQKIPFSVDKVRLSGTEGSTALADISQRLMDPRIPESRRDIAPICTIKTRLFDTLVGSENRSLKPVGKNHYIARVRLQPGDTTINIASNQWLVRLPQNADARDYLITLYRPVDGIPELHVFAVDDLLAADKPHIPAWLPDELQIKTKTKAG
jgi:hypothetical protein